MNNFIHQELYFNDVGVSLHFCGVFSERADACIVPQYQNGISLTGVSAAMIHSPARNGIIEFQTIVAKEKPLPFDKAYATACNGETFRYLIQIPVLGASEEITSLAIFNALKKADEIGLKTVIIPAVNTGHSGSLTDEEAAQATFRAIDAFAEISKSVKNISLNIYSKSTYSIYKEYLANTVKAA